MEVEEKGKFPTHPGWRRMGEEEDGPLGSHLDTARAQQLLDALLLALEVLLPRLSQMQRVVEVGTLELQRHLVTFSETVPATSDLRQDSRPYSLECLLESIGHEWSSAGGDATERPKGEASDCIPAGGARELAHDAHLRAQQ